MILCCGEALIDMIPIPTQGGQDGFVPHSGGAIFNTAIALGRLGIGTGMLTGLSTDLFGQQLMNDLAQSHVDTSHVVQTDRPTTLAFVHLADGQASYVFYDENSAGRMLSIKDVPAIGTDISALYFGGISLACEPAAETYAHLAETEGRDRAIMLDPNIRPGFIKDEPRYRARLDRMIRCADIVKVSDDDLTWIYPGPEPLEAKVDKLRAAGPKVVILTQGADGASAWAEGCDPVHVPVAKVETVVDTVGAGDTFNAGVLASLSNDGLLTKAALTQLPRDRVEAALSFGAKVAGVTVSRAGANPPWAQELT
jgi:fructokinase